MSEWTSFWSDPDKPLAGRQREDPEARWVHQLYREYDAIVYQYKVQLPKPLIRILDRTSTWATWEPEIGAITISRRLIVEHSWDVVVEILKHEMAHQWVSVYYGDHSETPHGARFQAACKRLGVAAWAARAGGELPKELTPWSRATVSPEEERVLDRVEKLLALADSSNEHEALLAMQRVRELQERYHLEGKGRSGGRDDMVSLWLTRKQKRISSIESAIHSILVAHFRVRVVASKLYDASLCEEYAAVEVLGARHDVLMAEFVHHFLWERAHAFWEDYRRAKALSAGARRSYMMGLLAGFRDKLAKSAPDLAALGVSVGVDLASAKALVVANEKRLAAFLEERYPRLSTRTYSTSIRDSSSYRQGRADGTRLSLNTPVGGAAKGRRSLLPAR